MSKILVVVRRFCLQSASSTLMCLIKEDLSSTGGIAIYTTSSMTNSCPLKSISSPPQFGRKKYSFKESLVILRITTYAPSTPRPIDQTPISHSTFVIPFCITGDCMKSFQECVIWVFSNESLTSFPPLGIISSS